MAVLSLLRKYWYRSVGVLRLTHCLRVEHNSLQCGRLGTETLASIAGLDA
jgi:hypothetical protein